ncbi:hypothetical protein ACOXXX_02615 [Thalassococcus sp. BH17M4-6]|uniref:hypothetical protein n=1 Tax=Thalassococcus sp. BH17M4-6 TaxID=3413148 RepID=UPI003BDA5538
MTEQELSHRLSTLQSEIARSDAQTRSALVDQLAHAVRALESFGGTVPRAARRVIENQRDAEIEAMFDNLPV